MGRVRTETVVLTPNNAESGGTGFLECRTESGELIRLHVDGSLADAVVREQVGALCRLAGMDDAATRAEIDRASRMARSNLDANRRPDANRRHVRG